MGSRIMGERETIIHSLLEIERRLAYLDIKSVFLYLLFGSNTMSLCSHEFSNRNPQVSPKCDVPIFCLSFHVLPCGASMHMCYEMHVLVPAVFTIPHALRSTEGCPHGLMTCHVIRCHITPRHILSTPPCYIWKEVRKT